MSSSRNIAVALIIAAAAAVTNAQAPAKPTPKPTAHPAAHAAPMVNASDLKWGARRPRSTPARRWSSSTAIRRSRVRS